MSKSIQYFAQTDKQTIWNKPTKDQKRNPPQRRWRVDTVLDKNNWVRYCSFVISKTPVLLPTCRENSSTSRKRAGRVQWRRVQSGSARRSGTWDRDWKRTTNEDQSLAFTLMLLLLWVTLTFELACRWAFRWAKVRSKSRLKSKSKVISLSERLRPNLLSKYRLRPKLSWTLV